MKKGKILATALFVSVLAVLPQMECQLGPRPIAPPRPLCASQFALVNYACSVLPYDPALPVTPPSPPSPNTPPPPLPADGESVQSRQGHRHGHRRGHRRGHRHGHRGSYEETPEEENCCRWLKELDNECVCDLLVRLPVFLARPAHKYTVVVDDSCSITYSCSGRLHP